LPRRSKLVVPARFGAGEGHVPGGGPPARGRGATQAGAGRQVSTAQGADALVGEGLASRVPDRALARGGDFAEPFAEDRRGVALSIDESRVERPMSGSDRGAGIRVVSGEVTRFAHVDGLREDDLLAAADGLASALDGPSGEAAALRVTERPELQEVEVDPASVPAEKKADLLRELDERARAAGDKVAQVSANYSEARRRVSIANSEGLVASDDRTR